MHEIETLEKQIHQSVDANFKALDNELELKWFELEEIYAFKAEGAFVRVRVKNIVEGEKPSRIFVL